MMGDNLNEDQMKNVLHQLGQLTGKVDALHTGLTARFDDLREDMHRNYKENAARIDRLRDEIARSISESEKRSNNRIDEVTVRVTKLEAEDKRIIEKVAGVSALGGGLAGVLTTTAIEFLKRFF